MSVSPDPYAPGRLRVSAWEAIRRARRVAGRGQPKDPTLSDTARAAARVALRNPAMLAAELAAIRGEQARAAIQPHIAGCVGKPLNDGTCACATNAGETR